MPNVERSSGVAVITPEGDINHAEMARVKNAITGLVNDGDARVVLDLSDVHHINYMTLGVLVERAGRLRRCGGELLLAAPSPYLRKILRFSGVEELFNIFESAADAAAHLAAASPRLASSFSAGASGSWVPQMH